MLFDAASASIIPLRRRIPGMQSVPLFVHFLVHRFAGLDNADAFYNAVAYDSENEDDAAAVLKEWLLNHNTYGSRPPSNTVAAIHVKAARAWLSNEKPRALLWKRGGDKSRAEPFPRIDGEALSPQAKAARLKKAQEKKSS